MGTLDTYTTKHSTAYECREGGRDFGVKWRDRGGTICVAALLPAKNACPLCISRVKLRGGPAGQLPGASTYKGRQDVTGVINNNGASKLRFPHAEEFLKKL
jgi:hypothetical protein